MKDKMTTNRSSRSDGMAQLKILKTSLALLLGFAPISTHAEVSFPSGSCAIVVASRQSVPEARNWILQHGWQDQARVFLSQNGWYSITVGLVDSEVSDEVLTRGKASFLYPRDSYCSTGRLYLQEISWRSPNDGSSTSSLLWAEFDARPLSLADKAFLQSALALLGDYTGLIDGSWGRRSQAALEQFAYREFRRKPTNADAAYLAFLFMEEINRDGWARTSIGSVGHSLVAPLTGLVKAEENGIYAHWVHKSKDLSLIFNDFTFDAMRNLHFDMEVDRNNSGNPYTVRSNDNWITSVSQSGYSYYLRSDLYRGTWSSIMVVASKDHPGDLALLTASIEVNGDDLFYPTPDGVLIRLIRSLGAEFAALEQDRDSLPDKELEIIPEERGDERQAVTGTAFYVNHDGVLLTNAHVVRDCDSISVGNLFAEVVAVSETFDLAALSVVDPDGAPIPFSIEEAGLNADITIAGYPLHGLLGGLNISRGSVSALKGLGGDEVTVQISAPVQPGNSGGPMIDQYGNVVGVVVSKLDAMEVANLTGDIAQNINFAIRGSMAKTFLSTNGIRYIPSTQNERISPEDAASQLQSSTRLVECSKR